MFKRVLILVLLCVLLASCTDGNHEVISCYDDSGNVSEEKENNGASETEEITENVNSGASETEETAEKENSEASSQESVSYPVRMFRIGSTLYYDTGEASKLTPRCGTLDSYFDGFCDENQIPSEDGMANFKTGDYVTGWQNAEENTKEVYIDGEWMIFRRLDDDIGDNVFCERLCAETESLHFYGGNSTLDVTVPVKYGSAYNWGVTFEAKDISPLGMTLVIKQSGGTPTGELQTGSAYGLDRYNGKFWENVPYVSGTETATWHDLAYKISAESELEFRCDWEFLYGKLPSGKYRISKDIMDFRKTADYDVHKFYFQFEITE